MGAVFMESPRKSKLIKITVWAAALGLLLGVLSSLAMAGSADAHAVLKSISPKDGARLTAPPTEVVLSFNEPISSSFATVTVAGADGQSASSGKARVSGTTVTQPLEDLPDGRFTVTFRVVSEDGHPVSGRSTFTVVAAATTTSPATTSATLPAATSSAATSAPSATAAAESEDGDGRPLRLGLAIGVAGLAIAAGLALVARSRRDGGH
jgi:methionine-rich copper-binding protein CopC